MSDKEFGGGSDDLSLPKATVQKIITEILPQLTFPEGGGTAAYSQLSGSTASQTYSPSQSQSQTAGPNDQTFTRSARDLLISCSLEFLRMVSSESNDISEKESKKTISVEHVEQALTDLGFGSYIGGIRDVVEEWKGVQQKRVGRGERMKTWGGMGELGEDELRAMQEKLFGEARGRMEGTGGEGAS